MAKITPEMCEAASENLYRWFIQHAEKLPWRNGLRKKRDAYFVWISEIMLQQTQVETVKDYFLRWKKKFPTLEILAKSTEEEVLSLWQGLGYYSRAKNILKTAQIICRDYGGKFPRSISQLEKLPGIGRYTAGAISSFAFRKAAPILDGNLIRIFSRLYRLDFLPKNSIQKKIFWEYASIWASKKNAPLINEALMELGRKVCKKTSPLCAQCPLSNACQAFLENKTQEFPPVIKREVKCWTGILILAQSLDGKFFTTFGVGPFLKTVRGFPHFEASPFLPKGFPGEAEKILAGMPIKNFRYGKTFFHTVMGYKIEMRTLCVRIGWRAPENPDWLTSARAKKTLSSSLFQKALRAASFD